jgi:hypothetical protein
MAGPAGMQAAPQNKAQAQVPMRPYAFPVGVYESLTQDYDNTVTLGTTIAAWTAPIQCPLWNPSPTGWLRGFWLDFTLTIAGNAATPAYAADGPWSSVQKVTIYDLGGEVVLQLLGYEWMIMNKFGGYFELGDPRADLTYSVTTGSGASAGSYHFCLYLPFEAVARDALGVVQNESKPGWKVELWMDSAANAFGVGGTLPTGTGTASVRVRGYIESYTEPASAAPGGRPFAQTPPLPGTLQYWKSESQALPAASTKYDLSNGIGFPIRNIIYYVRDAGNATRATADANWPDPSTLLIGNVNFFTRGKNLWITKMSKAYAFGASGGAAPAADTAQGRENGVFPVWFTQDFTGLPGSELRFKYLDTQVNSLVRFTGSFGGATTFFALTNWLATPSQNRYALIAGGQ